ncbi:MAG: HU family DNA-binding protein [Planctomycetota bacterium]
MKTITKKELVHRIAQSTGQTKVVVKDVIQAFLDATIDELARGNRLEFREFGVFETKERAARRAQNPRTLEKVEVPAKRTVKFKPGRLMREQVSDGPAEQNADVAADQNADRDPVSIDGSRAAGADPAANSHPDSPNQNHQG